MADAVAGAGAAGTVHLLDASDAPIPAPFRGKGTHTFSLADVVELARAIDKLPRSLLVYGIEGGDFSTGEGLTEPVARAVEDSAAAILRRSGDALMCLGAIGVIREVFEENGLPMARVEGDVRAPEVCLLYVPDARPATTCWSSWASPSRRSNLRRRPRHCACAAPPPAESGRSHEVTDTQAPRARSRGVHPLPPLARGRLALAFATALISGVAVFANGYGVTAFGSGGGVYTTAKNLVAAVVLLLVGAVATKGRSEEGFTRPRTGRQWAGLGGGRGDRRQRAVPAVLRGTGAGIVGPGGVPAQVAPHLGRAPRLAAPRRADRAAPVVAIGLLLVGQAALQGGIGQVGFGSGEVMILAATLLWSIEVIVAKRLLGSLSSLTVGTARMALGCVVLLAYVAVTGEHGRPARRVGHAGPGPR